jgi:hypothetical protein
MKNKKLSKPEVKAIAYICDVYLKCISNEKFSLDKIARTHHIDANWTTQLNGKYVKSKGHKSMLWEWVGDALTFELIEKIMQDKSEAKAEYMKNYFEKIKEVNKPSEVSDDEFNMFNQLAKKLFGI